MRLVRNGKARTKNTRNLQEVKMRNQLSTTLRMAEALLKRNTELQKELDEVRNERDLYQRLIRTSCQCRQPDET